MTWINDQATQNIYDGVKSLPARQLLPQKLWSAAQRKLDLIFAASDLDSLRVPPGICLEGLAGNLEGEFSVRVNSQYRIKFTFDDEGVRGVRVTDYR